VQWEKLTGIPNVVAGLRSALRARWWPTRDRLQLRHQHRMAGQVVEAVTGVGLDVAIKQGVTGPLGMNHTTFLMTDDERLNCTPCTSRRDGNWVAIGEVLNQAPEYWAGGHGLYGPPTDYIRFEQALLRGGELDGARILRPETVDDAFRNQIGELDFPAEIPTADPASSGSLALDPGTSGATGCCSTPRTRRGCAGPGAGPGRDCAIRTSGRPDGRGVRLDLQQLSAVRHAGGTRPVPGL